MSPRRSASLRPLPCVACLAALLLAPPAPAATLRGRLASRDDGRPVAGATVRLLENGRQAVTDASGAFAFADLAPGRWTLSTHHVAWSDEELATRVAGDDSVRVELRPAIYRTDEVIVRGARTTWSRGRGPWAADALTTDRLADLPAATPAERMADMPGVALVRDGAWQTAVSIRGLGRSNVVSLVDHTRIETANDLAGALSLVQPADLERVEVMKSSGSVLFGSGALGGAVQMMTRRAPFADAARWSAEWTEAASSVDRGVSHHLAAEHSTRRTALRLSGGYRDADDTRTPRGVLANSRWTDWSLGAGLGVRTVGEQSLQATWQRVQAEDAGIPGGSPIAATATATYRLARRQLFGLEYALPNVRPRLPLVTARLSWQEIARNVEIVQSPTVTVTPHATHRTGSAQLESRWLPARHHVLVVGAEAWQRELDSRRERRLAAQNRIVGERPVPRSAHLSAGAWAQDEWELARDRARVVLGARGDWSRTRNDRTPNPEYVLVNGVPQMPTPGQVTLWPEGRVHDASWDANAGLHVTLNDACSARLNVATAFRSPSLEERFQYLDLGSSLHVGNPDLRPERSVSVNVGGRVDGHGTRIEADAFVNGMTDLVSETPGTFLGRAAWVKTNIGRARLHGCEVAAEQRLPAGSALHATLSFVRGRDTRAQQDLSQIAPIAGTAELSAPAGRLGTLRVSATATHRQNQPGPDEKPTAGWTTWNAGFTSAPIALAGFTCRLRGGVDNVFDRAYQQHLSTLRGLVKLEPGRSAWVSVSTRL